MMRLDERLRVAARLIRRRELLWQPPGHFYSPVLGLDERQRVVAERSEPNDLPGIDLRADQQFALLQQLSANYASLPFTSEPGGHRYHFDNDFYSYSDAIIYALVLRHFQPKHIIEVGSGYSSALALDVNDMFLGGNAQITFIEPFPEVLATLLSAGDLEGRLMQTPLQHVPLATFDALGTGDVLFIDSTHIVRTGSDVNYLFFEILPRLAQGVLVHIHDVFYPFEYPEKWVLEGRSWTEAYLLRAFLQFNEAFRIELFSGHLHRRHREWFAEVMPLCLRNIGGSVWLRKLPSARGTQPGEANVG